MASFSDCQWAFMAVDCSRRLASSSSRSSRRSFDGGVGLLLQRHLLDLELAHAPLDDVDLGRHRVDLDTQAGGGLVDEVDGLVGQEPPGDVPVGQHGGGHQRGVLDADAVVHLVALLQPPQDGDGVLHAGLADVDLLEAALQRRVLLHVLAELVERGGADHAQLAPGQHRLEHVAGVHGALGRAGTDDGVHLVDEGDDLPVGVGDLLEDGLEPLLELAPVLGPGHHGREVEGDEPLVLQAFGDVALDDAPGQALDDGRLAHAGLADEDGVVLRPPGQHLDHPPDLLVAADDRVELPGPGGLGQVTAVALQRLVLLLGVLAGDPVAAPHLLQGAEELLPADADAVGEGQQEVLGREVLVVQLGPGGVGRLHDGSRMLAAELRRLTAVGLGQAGQRLAGPVAEGERRHPDLARGRAARRLPPGRAGRPPGDRGSPRGGPGCGPSRRRPARPPGCAASSGSGRTPSPWSHPPCAPLW